MDNETDFGWALDKMRDGYPVRRAALPTRWIALPEVGSENFVGPDGMVVFLMADDLLAYDWELAI